MKKNFIKKNKKYIGIVVSFVLGSIVTMVFFPLQKEIEQYYWKKQFNNQLAISNFEKRLDLIGDLHESCVKLNECLLSGKVENRTTRDLPECFVNSINDIWRVGMVSTHYFDKDVTSYLNKEFVDEYQMLDMRTIISPHNNEDQILKFKESCEKLGGLMQDGIYSGLSFGTK